MLNDQEARAIAQQHAMAHIQAPAIASPASPLGVFEITSRVSGKENALRELFAAERLLLGASDTSMTLRSRKVAGKGDLEAKRAADRRRKAAQQKARRLARSRS